MIKASIAHERSASYKTRIDKEVLSNIDRMIEEAIQNGEFSIIIDDPNSTVVDTLHSYGYTINDEPTGEVSISW